MTTAALIKPGEYDYVIPTFGEVLSRLIRLMGPIDILPAHQVSAITAQPPREPKTRRVLLVDADKPTRCLLKGELAGDAKYNFAFTEADSFPRALEILAAADKYFDLLIFDSDLETEAMSTEAFLREAKEHFAKTRIIYTANHQVKEVVEFLKTGADHVIDKESPDALTQFPRAA